MYNESTTNRTSAVRPLQGRHCDNVCVQGLHRVKYASSRTPKLEVRCAESGVGRHRTLPHQLEVMLEAPWRGPGLCSDLRGGSPRFLYSGYPILFRAVKRLFFNRALIAF